MIHKHPCLMRLFLFCCALLMAASTVQAQQGSSSALNGTVMDRQGAVISGATVVAIQAGTNIKTTTVTTGEGIYSFSALSPGSYRLTATHEGFGTVVMPDVTLRVGQMLTVNMTLDVAQGTEKVVVSGDSDLLETSTSQLSHYVTSKELDTWPLPDTGGQRDDQQFIFSSLPGTTGDSFVGSIEGGQAFSNEIYIDGISLGTFDTAELHESEEAVAEFNLQVGAMGAQYNGGGTAVTNYSLHSGTNQLHGDVFEFLQNEDLNANTFDNNQLGEPKPKQRTNSFGGTVGGPVFIPKIYDGRNKTWFYVSEEHDILDNLALSGTTSVPTLAERSGDLSGFLNPALTQDSRSGQPALSATGNPIVDALGRPVIFGQIYNPATQRLLTQGQVDPVTGLVAISSGLVRTPFPNNQIPTASFDPSAAAYLKLAYPTKYINSLVVNNVSTYISSPTFTQNNFLVKIDQQITTAHKVEFMYMTDSRYRSNTNGGVWGAPGDSPLDPWHFQNNPGKIIRATEFWQVSPRVLNRLGIGYNRFTNVYSTPFDKEDWGTTLGIGNIQNTGGFPTITYGGGASPNGTPAAGSPSLGGTTDRLGDPSNGAGLVGSSTIGIDQISMSFGAHQLTAGTEWRFYRENDLNISSAPAYGFGNAETDDGVATTSFAGNAFASFLTGQVNNASNTVEIRNYEFNRPDIGTFVQDDWKLSPKLTLNFGVRWEIVHGISEANGQMTSTNPFLANSVAGNLPGALQFAKQLGRKGFERTDWGLILPRFGFAYSLNPKAVVRGGFGVNTQAAMGGPEFPPNYEEPPSTLGFSGAIQLNQTSNPQPYPDIAVTRLSTPYPSYPGTLPNFSPTQANGQTPPPYIRPDGSKATYVENYNFGIQQDLGEKTIGEINYVGNTSKRIYAYGLDQLNQLPIANLAKYGDALLDPLALHTNVPTPYSGFSANNTVQQALAPFPQYPGGSMFQYDDQEDHGWSRYDSLQATLTRHVSKGFNILTAYTWSKIMTNTNSNCNSGTCGPVQDVNNPKLEKAVALGLNIAQQLKITTFYTLPFGPGLLVPLHGPLNWVAGGWTASANLVYQSGLPLNLVDSGVSNGLFSITRPNYTGVGPLKLNKPGKIDVVNNTGPQYLNPEAFGHVTTSCDLVPAGTTCNNVALTTGNVPSALGTVFGPGLASESASLQKNFSFGEVRNLQLRTDAFNLFNRAGRGTPVLDINSPSFGQILTNQYTNRIVQVSGKFRF
jgi:Carboxypeptidase regulatory-like domain/TonB dependent receptor